MPAAPARLSVTISVHRVEHVYSELDLAPGQAQNFHSQLDGEVAGL